MQNLLTLATSSHQLRRRRCRSQQSGDATRWPRRAAFGGTLLVALLLVAGARWASVAAASGTQQPQPPMTGTPRLQTIPFWQGSFPFQGTTYPYEMVGRDPARTTRPTTVGVDVYPVRLTFSAGQVIDGSQHLRDTFQSPVFRRAPFATGNTQFGHAVLRATFWSQVAGTDWGVLLDPERHPTLDLTVPADNGRAFRLSGLAPLVLATPGRPGAALGPACRP